MNFMKKLTCSKTFLALLVALMFSGASFAGEADLVVPNLKEDAFQYNLLLIGIAISVAGLLFGLFEYFKVKAIKAHKSMTDIGNLIFETCKTYLVQQGKFLIGLEVLIGICIAFYFGFLQKMPVQNVLIILAWSVLGILGSYGVAWFGIRMNTLANSRTAFKALEGNPLRLLNIPLSAGMSIGVLLVSIELIMMLVILLFVPGNLAGACFIGFAIGESLGASALRVAGGIFTKIADIGSDLMKIVFKIKEFQADSFPSRKALPRAFREKVLRKDRHIPPWAPRAKATSRSARWKPRRCPCRCRRKRSSPAPRPP